MTESSHSDLPLSYQKPMDWTNFFCFFDKLFYSDIYHNTEKDLSLLAFHCDFKCQIAFVVLKSKIKPRMSNYFQMLKLAYLFLAEWSSVSKRSGEAAEATYTPFGECQTQTSVILMINCATVNVILHHPHLEGNYSSLSREIQARKPKGEYATIMTLDPQGKLIVCA